MKMIRPPTRKVDQAEPSMRWVDLSAECKHCGAVWQIENGDVDGAPIKPGCFLVFKCGACGRHTHEDLNLR